MAKIQWSAFVNILFDLSTVIFRTTEIKMFWILQSITEFIRIMLRFVMFSASYSSSG